MSLAAFRFRGVSPSDPKRHRGAIVSARAEAREIWVCRSPWTGEFLDELAAFPQGLNDDQVDALSAAYAYLAGKDKIPEVMPISFGRESPWRMGSDRRGESFP